MKLVQFPRSRSRSTLRLTIASVWPLAYLLPPLSPLIASEPLAKGIQDNSFFIEEAYNQEPGMVQHIFNLPIDFTNGSREIAPSFTQEWPVFSQTHQFSYTIPYVFTEDDNGMEDMRLNYRLQAFMEDKYTPAFAPRLSLVLPTGDSNKGFGTGVVGYENFSGATTCARAGGGSKRMEAAQSRSRRLHRVLNGSVFMAFSQGLNVASSKAK